MSTLVHADIFFFVTTIAVAIITILFVVVVIYVIGILNDLHYVAGIVRKQTDLLAEDIDDIRKKMQDEGLLGGLFGVISRLFMGKRKRSSDAKHKHVSEK